MTRGLVLLVLSLAAPAFAGVPDAGVASHGKRPARTLREVKLLYFWASWCSSCRTFEAGEVLSRLSARVPGLVVQKVDVDTNEALLERYGVTVTPTLVLVDAEGFPLGKPELQLADADATLARVEKLVRKMAQVP